MVLPGLTGGETPQTLLNTTVQLYETFRVNANSAGLFRHKPNTTGLSV